MFKKFKYLITDELIFTSLIICGVGIASFYLGRYSTIELPLKTTVHTPSVTLQANNLGFATVAPVSTSSFTFSEAEDELNLTNNTTKSFVASKSGTKYHLITCPGAKQIKEENKIYFSSKDEAEAAGYTKASNCPDL